MPSSLSFDFDFAAFDAAHHAAKRYLRDVDDRGVFPTPEALQALEGFDEPLPDTETDPLGVIEQLDALGSPATVAQMGARYFGFVNGGALPAALAARQLAGAWDQNPALNVISPIAAKLEAVCEGWMAELLDLPQGTALGLVPGTSMSLACGFVAARNQILGNQGWDVARDGLFGAPPMRVIVGDAAHGTVWKALSFIGLGKDRVERVPCDEMGRMLADHLPPLDETCLLILAAGNVNTGAFDPFADIVGQAKAAGAWVHIDGAFGLWAGACQATRHLTLGAQQADSWSCDAHKTLNTPYDCGLILCRDRLALVTAMQASGSYIQWTETGRDNMLYSPDMSRRARSVELWAALKSLGRVGVDALISNLCARAAQFAKGLSAVGYRVLNEVAFNQVAVCLADDETTAKAMALVQQSGVCWVSGAVLNGTKIIRISVCSYRTTASDVERSIAAFAQAARQTT